jgi:hypothetical protein
MSLVELVLVTFLSMGSGPVAVSPAGEGLVQVEILREPGSVFMINEQLEVMDKDGNTPECHPET